MDPVDTFLLYEKEVAEFKLRIIRRLTGSPGLVGEKRRRRTSNISIVENVLHAAGTPLHISEIIASAQKQWGVSFDRDTISSALGKQIRKGRRFVHTGPNTFGLRQT